MAVCFNSLNVVFPLAWRLKDPSIDRFVADAVRAATKQAKERALKEERLKRRSDRMLAYEAKRQKLSEKD